MKFFKTQWLTVSLALALFYQGVAFSEAAPEGASQPASQPVSQPLSEDASTETTVRSPSVSPLNFGVDFQFLPVRYPNYQFADSIQSNRFGRGGRLGLEWLALEGRFGKGGLGFGVGYTKLSGIQVLGNESWLETFPVDAYLTYRFDYLDNQFIVPFVKGGIERHFSRQAASAGLRQYNGWNFSGGISFLLDWIDYTSSLQFDNAVGINNTYVTIEYLVSRPEGQLSSVNLARDEIRLGLRFEM